MLSYQLVQTRLVDEAVTIAVSVDAVVVAGRARIDEHAEASARAWVRRPHDEVRVARLHQAVTLAWGKQDTMNPIEQAGLLLRLNPHARLEVFDRCRQMPQEEHAERFNAVLRDAFRQLPSAAPLLSP